MNRLYKCLSENYFRQAFYKSVLRFLRETDDLRVINGQFKRAAAVQCVAQPHGVRPVEVEQQLAVLRMGETDAAGVGQADDFVDCAVLAAAEQQCVLRDVVVVAYVETAQKLRGLAAGGAGE